MTERPGIDGDSPPSDELRRAMGPMFEALRGSGMAMAISDPRLPDNPLVFVNDAFLHLTGYAAADVLGRNCRFLQSPETDPHAVAKVGDAVRAGRAVDVEMLNVRKDGSPFWNQLHIVPVPGTAGQPDFFFATQSDVTASRRADALQASIDGEKRRMYRAGDQMSAILAASGVVATWVWDVARALISGDVHFAKLYRIAPAAAAEGIDPQAFFAIVHPDDRPRMRLAVGASLRGADVVAKDYRVVCEGAVRWLRLRARMMGDDDGRPTHIHGVLFDFTEQKILEEQLRIAQTAGGIGTFTFVHGFATATVSPQFCRLLGLQPAKVLPVTTIASVSEPGHPSLIDTDRATAKVGPAQDRDLRVVRPDTGDKRWLARRGEYVADAEGAGLRFVGVVYDVTDAKARESELRLLNESLEQRVAERTMERDQIWQASSDLLCVASSHGYFLSLNPAWRATLGWSPDEMKARPLFDFVHEDDRPVTRYWAQSLGRGEPQLNFENRYRHKDGGYRWLSWNAVPRGALIYGAVRDVTEMKDQQERAKLLEEQLRQSQKMEAVGQLTGGLAHDFNNLLTGVTGSLELLLVRLNQGRIGELQRYITAAQGAAQRAAALTHRLLAFSRRQTLDPKPTNINTLIAGIEELVRRTVGPLVEIEVVAANGLWMALVDPNQLENALLNLCINGRDAMPDGGRLTIETENEWLDDRTADAHDLAPGPYLSLCVTDTGTGMTPDVIEKAFDPFFTTKPIGEGTGLGLSMIYGFARQSGGAVAICSEPGNGTTMCIYLPRYHGEATADERARPTLGSTRAGQGETVLIVDDEPTVRMIVKEVLEELGYTAVEAFDGKGGLTVLQSDARIDLLITDVGLPGGLNGRQMADAARLLRPDLKILFITGYAENAAVGNGLLDQGMEVLTKPFVMEALIAKIRGMIGP